jgi:hypothetical protein
VVELEASAAEALRGWGRHAHAPRLHAKRKPGLLPDGVMSGGLDIKRAGD